VSSLSPLSLRLVDAKRHIDWEFNQYKKFQINPFSRTSSQLCKHKLAQYLVLIEMKLLWPVMDNVNKKNFRFIHIDQNIKV
jgi:hypothetical protein